VIFGNLSLAFLTIDFAVLAQIAMVLVVSFSGLSFVSITKSVQMVSTAIENEKESGSPENFTPHAIVNF
jgi:hypothetical protein